MSWVNTNWATAFQGGGHNQIPVAWMYDLLYNEGVLTDAEKTQIDNFMRINARYLFETHPVNDWVYKEDDSRFGYQNTYTGAIGFGVVFALVSHDQATLDKAFVSTISDTDCTDTRNQWPDNIRTLRNSYDCDVIVDDVGWFNQSPFQDDIIARAVNEVTADGALYFSSAGNSGNKNDGNQSVDHG